jgi:Zn-dependent M28 family amino/carboxypeptidase
LVTGLAVPSAQPAALPPDVREAAERISAGQLSWDVAYLASDELLGRNTPSPGFDAAADYVIGRLRRAGVEPLGDAGDFRQHYDLQVSTVDIAAARLDTGDLRLTFGRDFLIRSFATPLEGALPVVYVGHGWVIPERNINPYEQVDVRGKLVLTHGPRALPTGVDVRQIGRITVNARSPLVEAERLGAAGVLFITQTSDLIRWDELRDANLVRRELHPPVPSAYAAPGVTSLLLSPDATRSLLANERVTGDAALKAEGAGTYAPSFTLAKRVDIRVPMASRTNHRPYNIVAVVRGTDAQLRNEYVTVAAHLDGAVGSRTVNGDSIYNSADDNATGSAGLLAIAEQLAQGPRPKRSIVLIWDSGEEQGLWGTRRFVYEPPVPLAQIVAHFNIDMIGASRRAGAADERSADVTEPGEIYLTGPGVLSQRVDALLQQINAAYLKVRFNRAFDRAESEFFYPRTDAGPFLERGILTIGFFTGLHDRYHLPSDEARFLDPVQLHVMTRMAFASVWGVADAVERPAIDRPIPETVPRLK